MKEDSESVWQLAVNEPEIDLEEAVANMFKSERETLKRNCQRVFQAIRTIEIMEEFRRDAEH